MKSTFNVVNMSFPRLITSLGIPKVGTLVSPRNIIHTHMNHTYLHTQGRSQVFFIGGSSIFHHYIHKYILRTRLFSAFFVSF